MNVIQETQLKKNHDFNVQTFFDSAHVARKTKKFRTNDTIFAQGKACRDVLYIQKGSVKLSVVSRTGKKAIVAVLKAGDFVGEGGLAGQSIHISTATAATPSVLLVIGLKEMKRVLHAEHTFSDRFITYMLERNIRIQEDLIDELFNSSEKRLARTLLLLARYGKQDKPQSLLPTVSHDKLAKMIGTSKSRVHFFMNKFEKLGFIKNHHGLQINDSLLNVVLHD